MTLSGLARGVRRRGRGTAAGPGRRQGTGSAFCVRLGQAGLPGRPPVLLVPGRRRRRRHQAVAAGAPGRGRGRDAAAKP